MQPSHAKLKDLAWLGASNSRVGDQADGQDVLALKVRDNTTNWRYLAVLWCAISVTIGAAIWAETAIISSGASHWWIVPIAVIAAIITGASQHQLGGVIHEGTHYLLFENKRLNELASDWLGAFPIFTSTYQFRAHHLAHHQFVNDPERDPDISQLKGSNHWLDFPVAQIDIFRKLAWQLYLPNLIRFTLVRARYSAVGHDENPYVDKAQVRSKLPLAAGIYFAIAVPFIVSLLIKYSTATIAMAALFGSYAAVVAYYLLLPENRFPQTRLLPTISHRATTISRMTFLFLLYGAFAAYDSAYAGNGVSWAFDHFGIYWVAPLFTTFPLYMMLRQWIQHGNADRGRYTNTRVFLANPIVRYAIFPWGMDYHLPHHVMASVPHYRLKELHTLLLKDPKYADGAVEVEGLFFHRGDQRNAFDMLGPEHAPKSGNRIYVDNDTLEYAEVKDRTAVAREAEASARG